MSDIFENKLKFKPDYKWPDPEIQNSKSYQNKLFIFDY